MPADVLAKLIIAVVTALLLLGLLASFLVPRSREPVVKVSDSHGEKLQSARKKRQEGTDLRRKADRTDSTKARNDLYIQAETVLWQSREIYLELIDAHDGKGYGYLQTEIGEAMAQIYHCQKSRSIELN